MAKELRREATDDSRGDAARDLYGLEAVTAVLDPLAAQRNDRLDADKTFSRTPKEQGSQESAVRDNAATQSPRTQIVPNTMLRPPASTRRIVQHLTVIPNSRPLQPIEDVGADAIVVAPFGIIERVKYGGRIWFIICVVIPIAVASIYYGFIASNQYVAEFRFTVTDTSNPVTSAGSGILAMLGSSGGAGNSNNYLVTDYLVSRQAAEELQKRIDVRELYSSAGIDWWSRFNKQLPMENFVKYWQEMMNAHYDQITGIATAQVRAFTPQDALLIANTLVKLSEELVNRIANRSENDAVRFAAKEVEQAEDRLRNLRAQLTAYRNKVGVIDPTTSVVASNSTLIQTLRANLAQLETQLTILQSQNLLPNAPAIVILKSQINSTKQQLSATEAAVGHSKDGSALSTVVGEYETLNLEVQFAQTMLTSTMQALDQARANAAAQHLYITPFVRPSLPQSSTYPHRLLSIGIVAALSFIIWVISLAIGRSIFERLA